MATSPTKVWTKLHGLSSSDEANALTTGLDGSIYVSGWTMGVLDGQTYSGGSEDAFLTRYNADGSKVWTKLLGSSGNESAHALTTGLDGAIYVSGRTSGALDGQANSGGNDAFLTKYSADGSKAWTKLLGTSGDDLAIALTTGLDGAVYVSGYTNSALDGQTNSGSYDSFLTKYSADGSKAWTKLLGTTSGEFAHALTTGLDCAIYVGGYTEGALDGQTNSGSNDAFLTKYSTDGTKAWTKLLGSSGGDYAQALTTGLDGSIYLSGWTMGALDGQANSGGMDAFLTKYSADGSKAWTRLLGSSGEDRASAITTGLDGSIYVSGYTKGALDGQTNSGGWDAFLTKYSADGSKAWTKLLGTSGDESANALATGLDGAIYVSGRTDGALDGQTNSGGGDVFLTKFQEVPTATYALSAGSSSFNEGSTATFTLTTTNLTSGTSVPYTLSGISAADVSGGSLSGNAVVNSSGVATISVLLLNDLLTEGAEILTVTAGGTAVSTIVNDTSINAAITSALVEGVGTVRLYKNSDGTSSAFENNVYTTIKDYGQPPTPTNISNIVAADYYNGYRVVVFNGGHTWYVDSNWQKAAVGPNGIDTTTLSVDGAGAITVSNPNDHTSLVEQFGLIKLYRNSDNSLSAFENGVYYPLKDTSYGGNPNGGQSGFVAVDLYNGVRVAVYSSGAFWYMNSTWAKDRTGPNGDDTGQVASSQVSTLFLSNSTPTYSLVSASSSVNEGSAATFTLTTTNLTSGTSVPYTLSGVSAADVSGGSLSGNAVVNSSGVATISVLLLNDLLTEGSETLTVAAGGASASTVVNDTSKAATYSLSASSASVNEGSTATFTLTTTNVTSGTSVAYTLSGVSSADITGGLLSGSAIVNSSGTATISVPIAADLLTEGTETLTTTAQGASAVVTINDTSLSVPTYSLSAASSSVDEGASATFTLSTINVAPGTSVAYTLSGVSASDIIGGALSGTATVNTSGTATILVPIAADVTTEGAETLTVTVQGKTAYVTINDTSKGTATYSLSAASASVDEGFIATFSLVTANVAAGTSISYNIAGVSTADITGGLTGTATVDANGIATINVAVAADFLTEGAETLTVTAQGKSASMTVNDTSKAAVVAAYALSAASNSVDEGAIAVFTLTTSNVAGGTSIPYTVSGISAADVTGGVLSGFAIVSSSGTTTISIPIAADLTTEGAETLTVTAQGKSASMTVNDTSKTAVPVVTATAAADTITNLAVSQSIDGGAGIDTLVYTSNSTAVVISKSGGSTVVTNTATGEVDTLINVERLKFADTAIALDTSGVGGQAYRVYKAAFNRTPDLGGLGFWISGMDGGVALNTVAQGFVNSAEFKAVYGANPTNAQIVTRFYDNVLGRAAESGGYNYWLGVLNSGNGTVAHMLASFSESAENQAGVIGVIGNGFAYTPFVNPTYSLVASATSVNEGAAANFTLNTTNVAAGTAIGYTLSGVSTADVFGGSLSGSAVVNSSGVATISVILLNDLLTEGPETLTVTTGGASASTVVNDTSKAIATYGLVASATSVNEGVAANFTLNTTNVAAGTTIGYTLSGISTADVLGGLLSGNAVVNSSGVATISVTLLNDLLTEGPETLLVTAGGATASIVVNDTSITFVGIIDGGGGGGGGGGGSGGD